MSKMIIWNRILEVYKLREVILNFISRELKTRYKGSILGFFWSFLNPLLNLLILALVFSYVVRVRVDNFVLFLLIGILAWQFLSSSLITASRSIIDNGGLIKKIYLSREIFPLSVVFGNLIHLFFSVLILLIFMFYFKVFPNYLWVLFPYFLFLQFIFVFGLALIFSSLSVYFRDVPMLLESIIPAWYFASPIFYPPSLIPAKFIIFYYLNPIASFITAYRDILLDNVLPSRLIFLITFISTLLVFIIGYLIFIKFERRFAEEI